MMSNLLVVLVVLLDSTAVGLEGLDLLLDLGLALLEGEAGSPVLLGLCCPVLRLLRGLEGGVLTDRGVGILVDLLHVLRADAVSEVAGELLLEAEFPAFSRYSQE